MKRLHVHVAVDNVADSVRYYSAMFDAQPSLTKPDYAKWMLDDPRINFAISDHSSVHGVDHLGMQVDSADDLQVMRERLDNTGAGVRDQADATCCYANSNKHWSKDPQGVPWEIFQTLKASDEYGPDTAISFTTDEGGAKATSCCGAEPQSVDTSKPGKSACC